MPVDYDSLTDMSPLEDVVCNVYNISIYFIVKLKLAFK